MDRVFADSIVAFFPCFYGREKAGLSQDIHECVAGELCC